MWCRSAAATKKVEFLSRAFRLPVRLSQPAAYTYMASCWTPETACTTRSTTPWPVAADSP